LIILAQSHGRPIGVAEEVAFIEKAPHLTFVPAGSLGTLAQETFLTGRNCGEPAVMKSIFARGGCRESHS
jgi:hypothetical protein